MVATPTPKRTPRPHRAGRWRASPPATGESYMWSPRGALKEVTAPGVVTTFVYEDGTLSLFNVQPSTGARSSYVYDGDNLRRQTREGVVTATMVWDGSDYLAVKRSVGDDSLFVNLDGEAIGEIGPSKGRDYIVDPLGSVAGYVDTDGDIRATFEYWPFGEMVNLPEDGEGPLLWVGSLGYYKDVGSRYYVRAREYEARYATWLQIDPLWPVESTWHYVWQSPAVYQDWSGLSPTRRKKGPLHTRPTNAPTPPFTMPPWIVPPLPKPKPLPSVLDLPWAPCSGKVTRDESVYILPWPYYDSRPSLTYWGYGNWCGRNRPGVGAQQAHGKKIGVVDALDGCCFAHDQNLGNMIRHGVDEFSHCGLLGCAQGVDCSKSPTPDLCKQARDGLITIMTLLCVDELIWPA